MDNLEARETTDRQVKLPLTDKVKQNGDDKLKEKESNNKIWVVVIFVVTVLASLVFSFKRPTEIQTVNQSTIPTQSEGFEPEVKDNGWFGPAKYEFGN
jgi:hypothetical protein